VPPGAVAAARSELLALGAEVEVVSPAVLRDQMRDVAASLASLYRSD